MLQVIISPAKQMRAAQDAFEVLGIPPFVRETARLHRALLDIERNEGSGGLQALWNVSDRLLTTCLDTLHEFMPVLSDADLADPDIARRISPAVMSYHGIQYQSMAPEVMDSAQLDWLQNHLWILSGLYGCVRPFHAVEPYRLEMGAKLAVDNARDLYAFWGDKLARVIAPAGSSKKARGSMVRWMAENKLEDASELTAFDVGYRHFPELSNKNTLVFLNEQAL